MYRLYSSNYCAVYVLKLNFVCLRHNLGRDITQFIMEMLRDRKEAIPPEDLLDAARCVPDIFNERF